MQIRSTGEQHGKYRKVQESFGFIWEGNLIFSFLLLPIVSGKWKGEGNSVVINKTVKH